MDLAQKYGADIAIFLHNLVFWVEKNMANGKNCYDGRFWTYNTMDAFAELYPLWSRDQIKRMIAKCREKGLILVGEYNKDRRDRTKWYSPSDEILAQGESFNNLPTETSQLMDSLWLQVKTSGSGITAYLIAAAVLVAAAAALTVGLKLRRRRRLARRGISRRMNAE